jgi:hypothetical protein
MDLGRLLLQCVWFLFWRGQGVHQCMARPLFSLWGAWVWVTLLVGCGGVCRIGPRREGLEAAFMCIGIDGTLHAPPVQHRKLCCFSGMAMACI